MAQQYPASWKQCANCAYWTGNRETDYYGQWSKVNSSTAKGTCKCRTCGWFNHEMTANFSACQGFSKWAALK